MTTPSPRSRPPPPPGPLSRDDTVALLCGAAVEVALMDGGSVTRSQGDGPAGLQHASNPTARRLQEWVAVTGEGPTLDACRDRRPCLSPDLADPLPGARWSRFVPEARALGVLAIHALPVLAGSVCLGALTVHADRRRELDAVTMRHLHRLCDALAIALVLESAEGEDQEVRLGSTDALVHQAFGMVKEQLGVPMAEAMARVRRHAYDTRRALPDVAADVVERRLTWDDHPPAGGPPPPTTRDRDEQERREA